MRLLTRLFANNRAWAAAMEERHPGFFAELARQQAPTYLWIGCSDSRVPANEIVGLLPGELFVHRNVANLVVSTDTNCLAVLEFAVGTLGVEHVIVCGHYGCGGIRAALEGGTSGFVDSWLQQVREVAAHHEDRLRRLDDLEARADRLCELNVVEQVARVCQTRVVSEAWRRGRSLAVHGWIYRLQDGLLRDFGLCVTGPSEVAAAHAAALEAAPAVPRLA